MPITINGSGTVTGISAGGLPDNVITTNDIADGAVTMVKRSEQMTLATAQASTSGTAIDFTGIPSWVKKITVMFNGVSTSGTSVVVIQIGSGSFVSTGYTGSSANLTDAAVASVGIRGAGFGVDNAVTASAVRHGTAVITSFGGNLWVCNACAGRSDATGIGVGSGSITLSGTLDRVRITTVNGTDTFDAGSINILYEG